MNPEVDVNVCAKYHDHQTIVITQNMHTPCGGARGKVRKTSKQLGLSTGNHRRLYKMA